MTKAKTLFLKFASEEIYETNTYGQILRRNGAEAHVYILGVFANEEPNFLFSYNITSLTDSMKKKLNRERLNVGRASYAERIKAILKNANDSAVETLLLEQVEKANQVNSRTKWRGLRLAKWRSISCTGKRKLFILQKQNSNRNRKF